MMILTRKLKLKVGREQHLILMETLNQYRECVNIVYQYGFLHHLTSGQRLHHSTYNNLRQKFPNLPSALVCVARVRATEVLKSIKSKTKDKWNIKQPQSSRYPAMRYNSNCCSIGKDIFAVATVQGRIKLGIINNPFIREDYKSFSSTCELLYKNKEWYLIVFVETKEQKRQEIKTILGIDRGIKNIAVLSNSQFFNSKNLRNVKGKYRYLRKKLQAKGTRSAKRLLKRLSGRENRFVRNTNHVISKQIATLPFDTFVLEKLDIHTRKENGKKFNALLSGWAWHQLETFLTYKAKLLGKKVEYVDARYTSQKCSTCSYVSRNNRKSQAHFCCKKCGKQLNADLNASRNIRNNYIATLSKSSCSRMQSIIHTAQSVQD